MEWTVPVGGPAETTEYTSEKGKPVERRGRKATGLPPNPGTAAGLPVLFRSQSPAISRAEVAGFSRYGGGHVPQRAEDPRPRSSALPGGGRLRWRRHRRQPYRAHARGG